jgi:hypothetical protein
MLGYEDRAELRVCNLDEDIRVDAAQRDAFHRDIERQNYVRNFEVSMRRKNGSLLLAAESTFATRGNGGKIERLQGFVLDVTEKRRAENEMRRRNRELNALNAMAVVATQSFDLDEILNLTLRQVVSLFGNGQWHGLPRGFRCEHFPAAGRLGTAESRSVQASHDQFCRRIWRSGHAFAGRGDYLGISSAPHGRGGRLRSIK